MFLARLASRAICTLRFFVSFAARALPPMLAISVIVFGFAFTARNLVKSHLACKLLSADKKYVDKNAKSAMRGLLRKSAGFAVAGAE